MKYLFSTMGEVIVLRSEATNKDILCGRGNGFLHHPGNINYLKVIKKYQTIYQVEKGAPRSLTNNDKRSIVNKVIEALDHLDPPGRFLKFICRDIINGKKDEVYHIVTDHNYKVKKVSQALREKFKPRKPKQALQQSKEKKDQEDQEDQERLRKEKELNKKNTSRGEDVFGRHRLSSGKYPGTMLLLC